MALIYLSIREISQDRVQKSISIKTHIKENGQKENALTKSRRFQSYFWGSTPGFDYLNGSKNLSSVAIVSSVNVFKYATSASFSP